MSPQPRASLPRSQPPLPTPWADPPERVLEALATPLETGLSDAEARRRLHHHGPNRLRQTRRRSTWRMLWDQFANLIVLLLVAAAAVAFAFEEHVEGFAIVAVLLINAAIGFLTERRAVRSMEALRELGRSTSTVRRDGVVHELPANELVPGDVVVLDAGDILTADLRLVAGSRIQVDESPLTGESLPVDKDPAALPEETALAERAGMLFKGTAVTRGSGEGVVVATGMATELGQISSLVESAEPEATPLEKRLDRLARRLIGLTLAIAAAIAVVVIASGRELFFAVEIAIALAVATIPEGLPIVATVALARGMWRMARKNALIEHLAAVETLGSTSVILTDKTGTLTENRMTVVELHLPSGRVAVAGTGLDVPGLDAPGLGATGLDATGLGATGLGATALGATGRFSRDGEPVDPSAVPGLFEALRAAVLCNNATFQPGRASEGERGGAARSTGDPTEVALLVAGAKAGLSRASLLKEWPELREIAFDPETKRMATLHAAGGAVVAAVKGAPESIVECCTRVAGQPGETAQPLDAAGRAVWLERAEAMAGRGERVLALASGEVASPGDFHFEGLALLGLVGFFDPPRERVRDAVEQCQASGIRVVMVTGDHGATAWNVAAAVGLIDPAPGETAGFVDARTLPPLAELTDDDARALLQAAVIARASPRQKLDLIELYQRSGAVVAMTGDGVNDAPALKKADIGVAMGLRGTQVAREAADMVLRDDELGSIVEAVAQGRAIFANIRKFVVYLMSCNVSEIFAVALGVAAQGPMPILPLQILFLNLVTDVFPALALGVGEGSGALMRDPPRDPAEPVLSRRHWRNIFALGAVMALCVLGSLAAAVWGLGLEGRRATTVAFLTLAIAQLWHVFSMRNAGSGWLRNEVTRNPWVWGALALCLGLIVGAVHWPALAAVLSLAPPDAAGWAVALFFSLLPLAAGQLVLLAEGRRASHEASGADACERSEVKA